MASRVTSAASSSSESVPRCRRGAPAAPCSATSALLSWTWICNVLVELQSELAQDRTRLDHRPGAIGEALVPGRRQTEHHPGVARAERADDHVVLGRRVLDHDEVAHRRETKLGDGRPVLRSSRVLEVRVDPGAGDDPRPLQRADIPLILADPLVDGFGREQPLLDQERLQRLWCGAPRRAPAPGRRSSSASLL